MGDIGKFVMGVVTAVISLAVISVVLSRNANTSGVINSASQGLGGLISAAEAPINGGGAPISSGGSGGFGLQFLNTAMSGGGLGGLLGGLGGMGGGGGLPFGL